MGGHGMPIDAMGGQIILARKYQELSAVDPDRPAGTRPSQALGSGSLGPASRSGGGRISAPSAPRHDARGPCGCSSQRVRRQPS